MSGNYLVIEAIDFTFSTRSTFGSDEACAEFQSELAAEPEKGPVIAAPLRKIRWGTSGAAWGSEEGCG